MLEGARELLSRGAAAALITNGGEPAVAIDSEGEPWLCHPPRIRPRGTTGAGDAAAAGYIAATIRGAAFTDAIAQALACGAACCVTPETHLVLRRDVERLLPEVRIERLRRAKR
jgi:fructose-1-phosphate kinase PfkB-like protein